MNPYETPAFAGPLQAAHVASHRAQSVGACRGRAVVDVHVKAIPRHRLDQPLHRYDAKAVDFAGRLRSLEAHPPIIGVGNASLLSMRPLLMSQCIR